MVTVNFYTLSKKANSTKKPAAAGMVCQGDIVEQSSMLHPVISLASGGKAPVAYNYAYIPVYNRYYHVEDWTYTGGRWRAAMSVDVLASWRDSIGAASKFVLRSSFDRNPDIIDNLYPTAGGAELATQEIDSMWDSSLDDGWYVVGIVNGDKEAVGSVSYYGFNGYMMRLFRDALLSNMDWLGGIEEIGYELLKALFNPFQYIVSCMWFPALPMIVEDETGLLQKTPFGWWELPAPCQRMQTDTIRRISKTIPIPKHPRSTAVSGSWMNLHPYTQLTMDFRPFGTFQLDTTEFYSSNAAHCTISFDYVTGHGTLEVRNDSGHLCEVRHALVGVPVQLSQSVSNYAAAAESAVGGVITAAAGGVAGVLSGIGSAVSSVAAVIPKVSSKGNNGSVEGLDQTHKITARYMFPCAGDSVDLGSPLYDKRTLSTIPGYIQCADGSLSIAASDIERAEIEKHLTGGFFYE